MELHIDFRWLLAFTVLLIALKVGGYLTWTWLWVMCPLWLPIMLPVAFALALVAFSLVALVLFLVVAGVCALCGLDL